ATQSSSIRDEQLYLRKTSGQIGDNKADSVNYWDIIDDDAYDSYGGATDLWGTTWIVAEINSVDFGIDLYVKYFGSAPTDARIDHLQIKVYYTIPATDAEDWLNTNSVTTQDDNDAYVSFDTLTDDTSDWLTLTNFGFVIPVGSTIDGIEVLMDKEATQSSSIRDEQFYLRKTGGQVGVDKADIISYWDTIDDDVYDSYGGSTDLWGTTWTVAEINSANFGIDLYVKYFGSIATDARIDHLQIRVYYTEIASDAEDWLNTNSATTQDDIDTYVSFSTSTDDTSDWLQLTDFGFSIPSGATIDGIEIQIDKETTQSSSIRDEQLYLRKISGQVGVDKADTVNYWDTVIN
ncbi:hypothetical protein LCGC14_3086550, partial [marine sediment metagenome]